MGIRLLMIIALLALAAGCGVDEAGAARDGKEVPAYAAPDLDGDTVALADMRGDVVLLNVWATWCPPCREEMPGLEALHRDLSERGLRVVGVSIDTRGADAAVREFLAEHDITFEILRDADDRITRTFRMNGVPQTFLIDRRGRLIQQWIGRIDATAPAIREPVERALNADA